MELTDTNNPNGLSLDHGLSGSTSGNRHRLPNLLSKLQMADQSTGTREKTLNSIPADRKINFKNVMILTVVSAIGAGVVHLLMGYIGTMLALAGHTNDRNNKNIIIASDLIGAPANMIRYPSQRNMVEVKQLDLFFHWPSMEGFSEQLSSTFNNPAGSHEIIFVSLSERVSTYDMTARIKPIYKKFFITEAKDIGYNLEQRDLDPKAGFIDEYMIIQKNSPYPFSARCVRSATDAHQPYCMRDIQIGKSLSLTYRFHRKLIPDWLALDQTIRSKFKKMIK